MYRPPGRSPRGEWARFLHRHRQARDWSQTEGFKRLRVGLRLGENSRASYAMLDMGDRPPKPHEREFLVEFFGESPSDEDRGEPTPIGQQETATLAAMAEQARAITALVEELRTANRLQSEWNRGLQEIVALQGEQLQALAERIGDRARAPRGGVPQ